MQTKYQVIADVSSFERGMAKIKRDAAAASAAAQRSFGKISGSVLQTTGSLGRMAGGLAGAAGPAAAAVAVAAAMADGVNKIVEFERATSSLAAVLGTTPDKIADLTQQARALGSTTQFTASEVTQLQTELAKLGFDQQSIQQSTRAVLDLSAATGAGLGDAAALAGATLRAFNMDASEMGRVTSVLAVATTKSALDFGKLQTGMATVAPVAQAFGFSIEDTTALLGKLSDAGFDASSAATATRNILLNLANSNGKLAQALGKPVHNAQELSAALKTLRDKGVDLNSALAMTDKRSVAAFESFLTQAEGVGKLSKELTGCEEALQGMVSTMTDNVQGSLDSLSSAWEGLMLAFSGSKGVFRDIVDGLTGIVQALTTVIEGVDGAMAKLETAGKADYDARKGANKKEMEARLRQQVESLMRDNEGLSEDDARKAVYEIEQRRLEKKAREDAAILKKTEEELKRISEAYATGGVKAVEAAGFDFNAARARYGVLSGKGLIEKELERLKTEKMRQSVSAYESAGQLDIFGQLTKPKEAPKPPTPEEITGYDDNTIEGLRKHIADLRKEYEGMNFMTQAPQMTALDGQIRSLQEKLDGLTGKARKSSKAVKEIGKEGSLSFAKARVDELTKAFEMATTDAERASFAQQIELWRETVRRMEATPVRFDIEPHVKKADALLASAPSATDSLGRGKDDEAMFGEYETYIANLRAEIEGLGQAISDAMDSGEAASEVADLCDRYERLGDALAAATDKSDDLRASIDRTAELKAVTDNLQGSMSAVGSAMQSLGSIGDDNASRIMAGFGDMISQIGALIPKFMALSIATGTEKVTETSSSWYEIIPGIAALTASIISTFSSLKYATGGIVGGNSFNADRVPAMVQSGEMILNRRQQRNLFALLDGGGGNGGGAMTSVMRISGRDLVTTIANQNKLTSRLK